MIVHLINEEKIIIEENWILKSEILNKMDNGNNNILFDKYIIPKSSINYIEFIEKEGEN